MAESVYLRSGPPYPLATMPRAQARAFLLYVGVDPVNFGAYEGQGYLLALTPFDAAQALDIVGPPYPCGTMPRRKARTTVSQGKAVTIYPAATGNAARSSANNDTPAATWVPGKLSGAFNYEISIFSGGDPTQGGTSTVGILELIDPDGELDSLRTLGWDGAPVELRRGTPEAAFNSYSTVARLSTAGLRYSTRKKEVLLRDLAWQLTQAELHGQRYGGTGAADGDAALVGIIKPIVLGEVFNITPTLINANSLIYQVSCTSVLAVDSVKDGGAALAATTDYPTYAALAAAVIAPGYFGTCNALGLFKIGAASVYIITADVRGDNDTINGIAYPHTRASIARRIATGRGNIRLSDPANIDSSSFEYLEQYQSATIGYFWNSDITKADALSEVMAGCLGWWTVRLSGQLAVGQLEDPSAAAPVFSLAYPSAAMAGESRVDEPAMTDYRPPRRSTLMGWSRNYTPLSTNQIAGSIAVTPTLNAIYQQASRYTTSEDLWVAAGYPSSPVVSVSGGFVSESAAALEGNRQMRLLRTRRDVFEVPAVLDPFGDYAGRIIGITDAQRIGLAASWRGFCFGVAVNGGAKITLKLWG